MKGFANLANDNDTRQRTNADTLTKPNRYAHTLTVRIRLDRRGCMSTHLGLAYQRRSPKFSRDCDTTSKKRHETKYFSKRKQDAYHSPGTSTHATLGHKARVNNIGGVAIHGSQNKVQLTRQSYSQKFWNVGGVFLESKQTNNPAAGL
jgi:hypothetical protein